MLRPPAVAALAEQSATARARSRNGCPRTAAVNEEPPRGREPRAQASVGRPQKMFARNPGVRQGRAGRAPIVPCVRKKQKRGEVPRDRSSLED